MSTAGSINVWGAPVEAVAAALAAGTDAVSVHDGTTIRGDHWSVATADWSVQLTEYTADLRLPGDGDVTVSIHYPGESLDALHRLTDQLYCHLIDSTPWGVSAESEADGFPARSRTPVG